MFVNLALSHVSVQFVLFERPPWFCTEGNMVKPPPKKKAAVGVDAEEMKKKMREKLMKPQYNVDDSDHESGFKDMKWYPVRNAVEHMQISHNCRYDFHIVVFKLENNYDTIYSNAFL